MAKTTYRVQGVSIPDEELYQASWNRAKSLGLSFSAYVCNLIRRDLAEPQDYRVFTPTGEVYRVVRSSTAAMNEGMPHYPAVINSAMAEDLAVIAAAARDERQIPHPPNSATVSPSARTSFPSPGVASETKKRPSRQVRAQP